MRVVDKCHSLIVIVHKKAEISTGGVDNERSYPQSTTGYKILHLPER
jgi:hypothetical protein